MEAAVGGNTCIVELVETMLKEEKETESFEGKFCLVEVMERMTEEEKDEFVVCHDNEGE